jgi:plastocyanin
VKRALVLAVAIALLAVTSPASAVPPKPLHWVTLVISNFRYCKASSCSPLDYGYVRSSSGPVSGTDNAVINVKRYTMVKWVYRDSQCNQVPGCPGHNIYFENGTPAGVKKGSVPSNAGRKSIKVLFTQKRGKTIRYFCTVNGHYQFGMTGIIHIK